MTTAPALLPCPFCGGDAELSHVLASVGRNYFAVECADKRGCRVVVSSRAATEAEAIAAWNARPGDAARETAITEAIQALIDASDYFDNRADVNDGDYGEPSPNREMTLASQCDEALERLEALRARAQMERGK